MSKFDKFFKYNVFVICIGILLTFLSGCSQPQGKTEIKIGAVLPLTGKAARYGKWIQEGLELGVDEINSSGGILNKKLSIIYEDDQATATLAANAMQKLVNHDKVPLVYGSWASSSVLAQAPIAEKSKTILMAEAISPKIRDAGDYIFRMQPDARYYLKTLVPEVHQDLKFKKIALLYVNNDFGLDQANVFKMELENLGGEVVFQEAFEQGATDFKTELLKVKETKPDAVFCPAYTEIAIVLKQAKELGFKIPFLASIPFENPDILKTAGVAAEGVIYPHHFDPLSDNELVRQYQKRYKDKYGHLSEGFAALAYDGIKIIANVIKECKGTSTSCLKDKLYNISNFPGVTGTTTFDAHGDVVKPIILKTVHNNQFVRYEVLVKK